ncbi:MAG: hypothetical protein E2598_08495 [Sphingobium sp.]|nr:hypothetical protein [Sphingobium sp.]
MAHSSKGSPVSPAPRTMDDVGKDGENPPFPIPPAYVRAGIFAVIAAILTVIFTDQSWIVSAIIGFYLGMPKSKKSKKP